MGGHNSHKIHKLGEKVAIEALIKNGYLVTTEGKVITAEYQGEKCLLIVNVKPYTLLHKEEVTGRNVGDIEAIQEKQALNECGDTLLVFVDVKSGNTYCQSLNRLTTEQFPFGDIVYPVEKMTSSGMIHFWHVLQFNNLEAIPADDLAELIDLRFKNKYSKDQQTLF
jgi:hypothetical protein